MEFPEDLPGIIEYHMRSGVILHALPRRPVETVSTSGKTTASYVRPTIPLGCDGWRLVAEEAWRPLSDLPMAWRPFLDRKRGTPMDPRKPPPTPEEIEKKKKSFRKYETPIEDEEVHQ